LELLIEKRKNDFPASDKKIGEEIVTGDVFPERRFVTLLFQFNIVSDENPGSALCNHRNGSRFIDFDDHQFSTHIAGQVGVVGVVLEDGEVMKCTKNHKFLVNEKWSEDENDSCWISAEDLTENHYILAISE